MHKQIPVSDNEDVAKIFSGFSLLKTQFANWIGYIPNAIIVPPPVALSWNVGFNTSLAKVAVTIWMSPKVPDDISSLIRL